LNDTTRKLSEKNLLALHDLIKDSKAKIESLTIQNQELEQRFENEKYKEEKAEFLADKCSYCMEYINKETEECNNGLCESNMPEEYKQYYK